MPCTVDLLALAATPAPSDVLHALSFPSAAASEDAHTIPPALSFPSAAASEDAPVSSSAAASDDAHTIQRLQEELAQMRHQVQSVTLVEELEEAKKTQQETQVALDVAVESLKGLEADQAAANEKAEKERVEAEAMQSIPEVACIFDSDEEEDAEEAADMPMDSTRSEGPRHTLSGRWPTDSTGAHNFKQFRRPRGGTVDMDLKEGDDCYFEVIDTRLRDGVGEGFPHNLGPFRLLKTKDIKAEHLDVSFGDKGCTWSFNQTQFKLPAGSGKPSAGFLSPLNDIKLTAAAQRGLGIPVEATSYAYFHGIFPDMKADFTDDLKFLKHGGFVYFDGSEPPKPVRLCSLEVDEGAGHLFFGLPKKLSPEWSAHLQEQGRFHPVTRDAFKDQGASHICWITSGEEHDEEQICMNGGFAFRFKKGMDFLKRDGFASRFKKKALRREVSPSTDGGDKHVVMGEALLEDIRTRPILHHNLSPPSTSTGSFLSPPTPTGSFVLSSPTGSFVGRSSLRIPSPRPGGGGENELFTKLKQRRSQFVVDDDDDKNAIEALGKSFGYGDDDAPMSQTKTLP